MTEESSSFNPGKNLWGREMGDFESVIFFFSPFFFFSNSQKKLLNYHVRILVRERLCVLYFQHFQQKLLFPGKKHSLENPQKNLHSSHRFTWNILCDFGCIALGICTRLLQLH